MMSFLTYLTGFVMNFELLPILTDYANHLGYRTALTDTILKGDHLRIISESLVEIASVVSEEKIFF
jgi:hypothetical protein